MAAKQEKITRGRKTEIFAVLILSVLIVGAAVVYAFSSGMLRSCGDGTRYGYCSGERPMQCSGGELLRNASRCGCPEGFSALGNDCVQRAEFLEGEIHRLINTERENNGRAPLLFDGALAAIARNHSRDMLERNYFDHISPEGYNFEWRYARAGYNCSIPLEAWTSKGTENIYQGWTYSAAYFRGKKEVRRTLLTDTEIAEAAVNAWMNASRHRGLILIDYWTREGIGVAISLDGKVMVTQDFC